MLIDMYAKFGLLETAHVVFDHVSALSVVSWNALLTGYIEFHNCGKVSYCYKKCNMLVSHHQSLRIVTPWDNVTLRDP